MRIYLVVVEEENISVRSLTAQNRMIKICGTASSNERAYEIAQALTKPNTQIKIREMNIEEDPNRLQIGDVVAHYKREEYLKQKYGDVPHEYDPVYTYKIKNIATHTETDEVLVIYEALYSDKTLGVQKHQLFARPYDNFMADVGKTSNGIPIYRFRLIFPDCDQLNEED